MSKLLMISDSFTEHMMALAYPNYKYLLEAEEIALLTENHNTAELTILNASYPVSLIDCIEHFDGNKLLVFGDDKLLKKISGRIAPNEFVLIPSPCNYVATDLLLKETDISQFLSLPTILVLTFSNCSNIVNIELLLEGAFREKDIKIERHYTDKTIGLLDAMYSKSPEDISDYFFQSPKPQIVVKSVYLDEKTLKESPFSQIVAYFEKINPDYTILCLDADIRLNEIHLETFKRIFGKKPNKLTRSSYYQHNLRDGTVAKVFSKGSEEAVINELMTQNEWVSKMISQLSLPTDIKIL